MQSPVGLHLLKCTLDIFSNFWKFCIRLMKIGNYKRNWKSLLSSENKYAPWLRPKLRAKWSLVCTIKQLEMVENKGSFWLEFIGNFVLCPQDSLCPFSQREGSVAPGEHLEGPRREGLPTPQNFLCLSGRAPTNLVLPLPFPLQLIARLTPFCFWVAPFRFCRVQPAS